MLEKLRGFRTYAMLGIIAILGVLVDLQSSCINSPAELGDACKLIMNPWVGKAIVALTGVAAWFRKLAGTGK